MIECNEAKSSNIECMSIAIAFAPCRAPTGFSRGFQPDSPGYQRQ